MRHFIIVKFNDEINVKDVLKPIGDLFNESLNIDGIDSVKVHISNTNLPNRHDLMIDMVLTDKNALKKFDNSSIHEKWKNEYGKYIINKIIFDCD